MDSATLGLLALILGPLGAILGLAGIVYTAKTNRKSAEGALGVDKQQANTNEFDRMRQGFVDSIANLRLDLTTTRQEAAQDRADAAQDRADWLVLKDEMKKELALVTARVDSLTRERVAILEHLHNVERLIPNPPGPPLRPIWA